MSAVWLPSCDNDDESVWYAYPNALVTVKPVDSNSFYMQLDDNTTLKPLNLQGSPFGDKEVRALVNYRLRPNNPAPYDRAVWVYWIDSILTKPAISVEEMNPDFNYGNDPVEIIRDWVTVAEDVNLITGENPNNPYEVEFRHNCNGDLNANTWADGIVAFRLDGLPVTDGQSVRLTLRWQSFSGEKKAYFEYKPRATTLSNIDITSDLNPQIRLE